MLGQVALTAASLVACSFAPGFLVVRRLRWGPMEKVCGAVAGSLILLYLFVWTIYCFAPGSETGAFRAAACVAGGLAIWQWRDIRRLALAFGARQALTGFAFLLAWSVAPLAMIHSFSGAGWTRDWVEHFQRSLFFLHRFPPRSLLLGFYPLPARPPMMNLLGAFFLGEVSDSFEIFQTAFAFLNLLAFLPCCLMLGALVKSGKARYLPLIALFALNPMMMENAWYPWTKLLTAFFVVFAIWLYLSGLRKSDRVRVAAAFLCLAAGLLVHYSAGPYLVFLAGHYLLRVFPARKSLRELAAIAIPGGLLLATWFGWSVKTYGLHDTLASNTSVESSAAYQGSAAGKIAGNLADTLIPAMVRDPQSSSIYAQPNAWGELRDNVFNIYQSDLIFAMGSIGGPFVLWLLYREVRRPRGRSMERGFWRAFVPAAIVFGVAVVGERDPMGVAHLTLVPLTALGITFLAASFPWRRGAALLLIAGCTLDFALGIFLQVRVENMQNSPRRTIFSGQTIQNNAVTQGAPGPDTLASPAWENWFWKNRDALLAEWIHEARVLPQTPSVLGYIANMQGELEADARDFGGWYGRHGGRMTFLADHVSGPPFAGPDAAPALFLIVFAGLMGAFARGSLRLAPAVMAASGGARKTGRGRKGQRPTSASAARR